MPSLKHLKAIVFDWAGTMIDHGSRAPAIVFQEIFRQRGIEITIDQAREPMGMAKREHILAITQMPDIQKNGLTNLVNQPLIRILTKCINSFYRYKKKR